MHASGGIINARQRGCVVACIGAKWCAFVHSCGFLCFLVCFYSFSYHFENGLQNGASLRRVLQKCFMQCSPSFYPFLRGPAVILFTSRDTCSDRRTFPCLFSWSIAQSSRHMLQNGVSHRCACVKLSTKGGGIAPFWGVLTSLIKLKSIARYGISQR